MFYYYCYHYFDFIHKKFIIENIGIFCTYFKLFNYNSGFSKFKWIHLHCIQKTYVESWVPILSIFLSHFASHISQHTTVIWNIYLNEQMTHSLGPPTQEGYMKVIIHNKSESLSSEKEYHNREDHWITKTWHRSGICF